jgi:hypothetical protein
MTTTGAVLCLNFVNLIAEDDTTASPWMRYMVLQREVNILRLAGEALRETQAPDAVLPTGPIAGLLQENEKRLAVVEDFEFQREWHTWFTRLYRVKREKVPVCYPGGEIKNGSFNLCAENNHR